jgi:alkaline phosphatase D
MTEERPTAVPAETLGGEATADPPRRISRRGLLRTAAVGGAAMTLNGAPWQLGQAAALVRKDRPELTSGVQSGDVTAHSGTVWTRANRPSRMVVEVSTRPDFRSSEFVRGPLLTPESDFTGKTLLRGLPPNTDLHYRVWAEDLDQPDVHSAPAGGRLRTVATTRRDVSFLWSGDLGGQGFGINPDIGGYRIFNAMRRLDADFYICNGDNIYADDPIPATIALPDGSTWKNVTTEAKSKVAETLADYRGNYRYNMLDDNLRAFYASLAQIQQWDDHETHNNWYPGEILDDPLYTEKRVDVLARRARQAWHEYTPIAKRYDAQKRIYRVLHHGPLLDIFILDMRWYRDANSPDKQRHNDGGILGYQQAAWLKRELAASRATWKVISNDMPLCEVVADGTNFEAVSQGDPGLPLGRERQIADILRDLKQNDVRNTVWLTTDVHYTAAHYFDPDKAAFQHFDPFWQFTSGPLNAGAFPPDAVDSTFGAQQVFVKAPETPNASPATEYQFFGQVQIDHETEALTVNLRDNTGTVLWSTTLAPRGT